VIFIENV